MKVNIKKNKTTKHFSLFITMLVVIFIFSFSKVGAEVLLGTCEVSDSSNLENPDTQGAAWSRFTVEGRCTPPVGTNRTSVRLVMDDGGDFYINGSVVHTSGTDTYPPDNTVCGIYNWTGNVTMNIGVSNAVKIVTENCGLYTTGGDMFFSFYGDSPNGVCSSTLNSCTSGTFSDVADSQTEYRWDCEGLPKSNPICSMTKPLYSSSGCSSEYYSCDDGSIVKAPPFPLSCTTASAGTTDSCSKPKLIPDLTASSITPTTTTVGISTRFSSTITNIGTASTESGFNNFLQVATESEGGGTITNLTSTSMTTLASGASNISSQSHIFSSVGTFSVRACADKSSALNTGTITESNENNNCGRWTDVSVTPSGSAPDLTVGSVSPTTFTAGVATNFSVVISNTGTVSTGSGFNNIFQVSDFSSGSDPTTSAPVSSPVILGAGNTSISKSYTFSSGTKYIRVCVDKSSVDNMGTITESNEENNCGGWIPVTPSCPTGKVWNGTACVDVPPEECPPGKVWNGTACIVPPVECPPGKVWNGTVCITPGLPDFITTGLIPISATVGIPVNFSAIITNIGN